MGRKPRIFVQGGVYHVYNRFASGEAIFSDANEAVELVELIRKIKKRDGWTVFAWAVMSNHYHLVLRTGVIPLWRGMHAIQNGFSRRFNRRHRRTGGLWQGRYQARNVSGQAYLDRLVLYVHLNPVKAGLVHDPEEYVFAGHREVKRKFRNPLVDVDDMLLCFGETKRAARRSYLAAIRAGAGGGAEGVERPWHPFENDPELELTAKQVPVDELGRSVALDRPIVEVEEFIRVYCEIEGVDHGRIVSRLQDRQIASERRVIATLGVERWGISRLDFARAMNKHPDVVSWWVSQGAVHRLEDPTFAARLNEIDRKLSESLMLAKSEEKIR